jgi:hypothetical protein
MVNTKAIAFFKTLSAEERRWFRKWLHSPYHNFNKHLLALLQYLDTREALTAVTLRKERVFAAVFVGEAFSDNKIRYLLSDFLRQLELFSAWRLRFESPRRHQISVIKTYRLRGMSAFADSLSAALEVELEQLPARNAADFLDIYRLKEENYLRAAAQVRATTDHLQETLNAFRNYFAIETLKNACIAQANTVLTRREYTIPYLEKVLEEVESRQFDSEPLILFYYDAYCALSRPDTLVHYQALRAQLPTTLHLLAKEELQIILLAAVNFCIGRMNAGEAPFAKEAFELYRLGLDGDLLLNNGYLSRFTFKNAVTVAIKLGETDWAAAFIERCGTQLEVPWQSAYTRFCKARLDYYTQKPESAEAHLYNLEFDDIFLNLDARVLLVKIYFESKRFRLLKNMLVTFERFLTRKKDKISPIHFQNYQNFIRLTTKIMACCEGTVSDTAEIKTLITQTKPLAERDWLIGAFAAG